MWTADEGADRNCPICVIMAAYEGSRKAHCKLCGGGVGRLEAGSGSRSYAELSIFSSIVS